MKDAPTKANEQVGKRRLLKFFLGFLLLLLPLYYNLDVVVSISQPVQGQEQTLLAVDLLKTQQRWSPWRSNQDEILFVDRSFPPCQWANYTSQYDPTQSMTVCTHGETDLVSSRIMQSGNWNDCHAVSRQWYAASSNSNIHLEIGANIGSCIWELLLASPTAQIIAFEPHPRNLFALTSTLKKAAAARSSLAERVTVYPIALGTERGGTVNMVVELGGNMGSSIIERGVGNNINNMTIKNDLAETVPLERLDSILSPQQVRLAKFDIQGSECNVMDAMFPTIRPARVVAEVDAKLLEMGGCSASGLIGRLQKQDYQVFHYRHWGGLDPLPENIKRDYTAVAVSPSATTGV